MEEVLRYISANLTSQEAKYLMKRLGEDETEENPQTISDRFERMPHFGNRRSTFKLENSLQNVSWSVVKKELELMRKHEIVKHIQENTLITQGKNFTCV